MTGVRSDTSTVTTVIRAQQAATEVSRRNHLVLKGMEMHKLQGTGAKGSYRCCYCCLCLFTRDRCVLREWSSTAHSGNHELWLTEHQYSLLSHPQK